MSALVLHDTALADGTSDRLQVGVSLRIEEGRIAWIGPAGEADLGGATVIDAGGAVVVPALVDSHSHLTMQGGSHWIARADDDATTLRDVARANAARLVQAGVLWVRDVGAPMKEGRPLSIAVREELSGRPGQPSIQVAGTWLGVTGLPPLFVTTDGPALAAAAVAQLELGSDLVKVYMDGPDGSRDAAFGLDDLRGAVEAVHARDARIACHATFLDGARVAAEAGVDSIEHGTELDAAVCRTMRRHDVTLVSTLSVYGSWESFGRTTAIDRFTSAEGRERIAARRESAHAAVALARREGVRIATGSDFGGGSVRAGHLAWEVELLVAAGLEPHEALAAATRNGGALLGHDHAGRIQQGLPADLVLVHGDPLSDPRALWRVWSVYQRGVRVA